MERQGSIGRVRLLALAECNLTPRARRRHRAEAPRHSARSLGGLNDWNPEACDDSLFRGKHRPKQPCTARGTTPAPQSRVRLPNPRFLRPHVRSTVGGVQFVTPKPPDERQRKATEDAVRRRLDEETRRLGQLEEQERQRFSGNRALVQRDLEELRKWEAAMKQQYEHHEAKWKQFEGPIGCYTPVSYTHLRAHETVLDLVCRLLLEKKKKE
eukprot:TRINITY_DN4748_c0_g1_i3.p1 TRINITY_DN4748_c0_g1~~TRINITY_DN4748_c0_g1_i3.p1  ORF type:complete len:212 (-),score=29.05 TRINITY_DN4748_c0_g1_i3:9-644(-)